MSQFELPFNGPLRPDENLALWTPRDIWVRLNQEIMLLLREDRRVDYKRGFRVDLDDLATYYSTFSNTPDGGVIVFGADSKGVCSGCSELDQQTINKIERFHLTLCPQARPEFKRFEVRVGERVDFCIAIFIPYISRLVETNKGEAWIRYGDSKHKMSEEEKRDFRATRQELSFELDLSPYTFPDDFEYEIIKNFCDIFRARESRSSWTDQEVLVDRQLGEIKFNKFRPYNNLALLAAKNPRRAIPGCRIRVQRFATDSEGSGGTYAPIRDKMIDGNLVKIINDVQGVIQETIFDVTWLNKDGKFVTTPEYPKWAWLEAVVNACVHRSYSFSGSEITVKFFPMRCEIESPGGFVPPVNENTIYHTRAARNAHLMDALRYLGYVQMAREGTRRIRDSMKEWGLPDPQFKQEALHGVIVRVTLMNDHENRNRVTDREVAQFLGVDTWKNLQEHEVQIVAYAFRNREINVSEASRISGRTWSTSKKDLNRLEKRGILEFIKGKYPRDSKAKYQLKEK